MKKFFALVLLFNSTVLFASGESESKACDKIICSDLAPEEKYHCFEQKKLCHRRAFATLLEEWKKEGISSKRRENVLKALEDALSKNKEVTLRLQKEVSEIQNDIKEIEKQISSVKKLRAKN